MKTSPALHEQRKQLERAKTGDLLKAKIQQRPNRKELENRHILEHEEAHVDPSLAEKQRMLKKARLADQLNSQISHRPGPLELIKKNILHTDEPIERIVKEGLVSFKATSEGLHNRPQHPSSYITLEDDSQSSESDTRTSPARSEISETGINSGPPELVTVALTIPTNEGAVVVTSGPVLHQQQQNHLQQTAILANSYVPPPPPLPPPLTKTSPILVKSDTSNLFAELCQSVVGNSNIVSLPSSVSLVSTTSTLSPLPSVASPPSTVTVQLPQITSANFGQQQPKSDAPGKEKNRKKLKAAKPIAKARTIKFHEYKGPPNAQKSSSSGSSSSAGETSYQLLLKQRFLLEHLENLHKTTDSPSAASPQRELNKGCEFSTFSQEPSSTVTITNHHQQPQPSPSPSVTSTIAPSPVPSFSDSTVSSSDIGCLEKMKVSDLKLRLKKLNLPVSGPKTQLIDRLKRCMPMNASLTDTTTTTTESMSGEEPCDMEAVNSPQSLSPQSDNGDIMEVQQIDSPQSMNNNLTSIQQVQQQFQVLLQPQPTFTSDDLVREQQKKIEDLERKLREQQEELLQMKQQQSSVTTTDVKQEQPTNQKLVFKQQLEAKINKEKMSQLEQQKRQAEHLAFQQALKNNQNMLIKSAQPPPLSLASNAKLEEPKVMLCNTKLHSQLAGQQKKNNLGIVWNGEQTLFLVGLPENKKIGDGQIMGQMPSILVPITTTAGPILKTQPVVQQQSLQQSHIQQRPQLHIDMKPPPPQYEEATKQLESMKKENAGKSHIKSQVMTDVLEILIKNGELPASAANDPSTPTTPGNMLIAQNMLFQHQQQQSMNPQTQQINMCNQTMIQNHSPPSLVPMLDKIETPPLIMQSNNKIQSIDGPANDIVKTLDIFLGQPSPEMLAQLGQTAGNHIRSNSVTSSIPSSSSSTTSTMQLTPELNHYVDFELMDLMSSQLDMDITDDTCSSYGSNLLKYVPRDTIPSSNGNVSQQREMNPSLQPSIMDLMNEQIQMNSHQLMGNNNNQMLNLNGENNNHNQHHQQPFHSTPMDVEDFENSLNSFDFSTISGCHQMDDATDKNMNQLTNGMNFHQQNTTAGQQSLQNQQHQQNNMANIIGTDNYETHLPPLNHDNFLDILDDFKMSGDSLQWGEVDFAV